MAVTQQEKGDAFRALHEGEPFVIPNPWEVGSARMLEALGFKALATTSSGFAFTLGRPDGGATLDELAEHVRALSAATSIPVSVDLEAGHGDPAEAIRRMADAGAVGASIEDWDPDAAILYERDEAAERVAAAVEAAHGLDFPFLVTGRAENLWRGNPDLDHAIDRLLAYQEAGADVLYAPGLTTLDEIRAVCGAVRRPVNVLARPDLTFAQMIEAGAQRVSVGGNLTWVAADAAKRAAEAIRDRGDFSALTASSPLPD
jgi:2-methylisocitrate lyase-like PEP mutase family enzyme